MVKFGKDRQLNKTIDYMTFLSIAWKSYFQVQELCKRRRKNKPLTDEDIDDICYCNAEIQRLSISTIIFCNMTLESFINHYGATNFSKSYFENYLEKLDLKSKWIIIPKLVTGKQINSENKSYSYLVNLISLRNKLVHNKPKQINNLTHRREDWLWETDTFESLECVELIMKDLKLIDENLDINWVSEMKEAPYA